MSGEALLKKLETNLEGIRGRLTPDALMSKLTWFQVGGPADILFQPADEEDLALFLSRLPQEIPVMVVGVGSNLLVRDGGLEGVVIRLSAKGFGQAEDIGNNRIMAGAAIPDKRLAAKALELGLGGFEFYHGIPGGIGGALRMNAGANGTETTNRVVEVHAIDRKGEKHILSHEDMGYAYRHSDAAGDLIFTRGIFEGFLDKQDSIRARMDEVQQHRETVQPVKEKTGGSTFRNPVGHSSWKLIDDAGLRGFQLGGAQMSQMHCNFMINTGDATANDLELLGETVRERVYGKSGIYLNWEIKRVGSFKEGEEVVPFDAQRSSSFNFKNDESLIKEVKRRLSSNRDTILFGVFSLVSEICEFKEIIRGDNLISPERRASLLSTLERLDASLNDLVNCIPEQNSQPVSEENARNAIDWLKELKSEIIMELDSYSNPKHLAGVGVPMTIITLCAVVGSAISGPSGFVAGSVLGGLFTNHSKAKSALDDLRKNNHQDE